MPRRKHQSQRDVRWGDGYITPRPQGDGTVRYQARWPEIDTSGAQRWRAKTFATEEAASDFLRDRARKRRHGRGVTPSELTVEALIAEILDRSANRLTERTILTYRTRAKSMILPYLGSVRLIDLETLAIQHWVDQLGRDGYMPATIHAAVAVLHTVLRDAALLGMVDHNLAQGIRRPGIEQLRVTTWTIDEARRFIATVRADELYSAYYHVALATGMRPGELRALHWGDLDLERTDAAGVPDATVLVQYTMSKDANGREVIVKRTKKSRQGRAVGITPPVVRILRWHRRQQLARRLRCEVWHDDDLVFDRGDGHWLGQESIRRTLKQLCAQARVPFIRAHDLRHTSATLEQWNKTPVRVVSDRLGHKKTDTTLNVYTHTQPAMHRESVNALSDLLFGPDDDDATATTS